MMGEFRMPSLGADMEAGAIIEWRVHPGDVVHRGDIVALVDTDKADIEVEVFEDGVVEELLVAPGVEVAVGTVLARIASSAAGAPDHAEPPPPAAAVAPTMAVAPPAARVAATRVATARPNGVRASPLARRVAVERGIDLAGVRGSGPGHSVLAADVARLEPSPSALRDRHASARRATGELMARAKREIPHYYLATTVDLRAALDWLATANTQRPITERVLPIALLLKATALAAHEVPAMNGSFVDGFTPSDTVHLGVAVALRGGGLVAPALRDADGLALDALMRALRDLVQRARAGSLRSSDVTEPTITVTNLGEQGVDEVFGVIYPPQVALVGFGKIVERPWPVDGSIELRPVVRVTLSADHRASDGHDGARFLATIDRLLQHPEAL